MNAGLKYYEKNIKNSPKDPLFERGALFGINPERRVGSMANLLSASSVANLQKNAPERSEFTGAGTVLALSLSLSLSLS
jgi:hypothetical protein